MALIADFVSGQSNVTYTRMRELLLESGGGLQEGVVSATDLKVAQRGAGAAQNVDIPAGAAWITVDTGTRNGISHAFNDATANVTVNAADGTNPRIDQACLQYNDTAIPAGTGGNLPTFRIVTGTATAGATLDNRTGAVALPNDCLRLADILVPAASTSVTTANIRDRRPWARGGRAYVKRTTNAGGTNDYAIANASFAVIDATNLSLRLECSGATDVLWRIAGIASAANPNIISFKPFMDGASVDGLTDTVNGPVRAANSTASSLIDVPFDMTLPLSVPAGSHLFQVAAASTFTIYCRPTQFRFIFEVREDVRPVANNGTA